MTVPNDWWIEGTYFEACNCEAVCPCRQRGDRPGGRSTFGTCDFALSWIINRGKADDIDLATLEVVMAGQYDDDEPGSPWRVALYIDESVDSDQQSALADIFLCRAGGTTVANFTKAIDEVYAIRPAKIRLDHTAERQRIDSSNCPPSKIGAGAGAFTGELFRHSLSTPADRPLSVR